MSRRQFPDEAITLISSSQLVLKPADRRQAVIDVFRSAAQTLRLSIFRCDDFGIVEEITAAIRRNVDVKILVSTRARGSTKRLNRLAEFLDSAGAKIYRFGGEPSVKYHAKYIVADDKIGLISSSNFTRKCFESTCDFILVSHEPEVAGGLKDLFDHDCHAPYFSLPEISDRLIIGPERTRESFTRLLESARISISIIDHRVTDPAVIDLIENKRKSGVKVGILGRGYLAGMQSHGKMMVLDNQQAVLGSVALSKVSLETRREVAIRMDEPRLVQELNCFFEYCAGRRAEDVGHDQTTIEDEDEEEDEEI